VKTRITTLVFCTTHKLKGSVGACVIFFYFSDHIAVKFFNNERRILVRKTADFTNRKSHKIRDLLRLFFLKKETDNAGIFTLK